MKPFWCSDVAKRICVGAACLGGPAVLLAGLVATPSAFDGDSRSAIISRVSQPAASNGLVAGKQSPAPPRAKEAQDLVVQETPEALTAAASSALRERNYDLAIVLLRRAIRINKDDAGANYSPWIHPLQDQRSVEHGREQLKQMLSDRPAMAAYLDPSDKLWRWAASKYATRIGGSKIYWDASRIQGQLFDAEHEVPVAGQPGRIRVNNVKLANSGQDRAKAAAAAFEKLWLRAAFELHNIENAQGFQLITLAASRGEIAEVEYVQGMFTVEFFALQRIRRWYVEVYLPHAKKYQIPTDPLNWYFNEWGSAEADFARYTDKRGYPWEPYRRFYRELRRHPAKAK